MTPSLMKPAKMGIPAIYSVINKKMIFAADFSKLTTPTSTRKQNISGYGFLDHF